MGGFEIILVIIGLAWTIASGVMQKKAKAAKAERLKALANEPTASDPSPMPVEPTPQRRASSPLQERLAQLRDQIAEVVNVEVEAEPPRPQPAVAASREGSTVRVPQQPSGPPQPPEDRGAQLIRSSAESPSEFDLEPQGVPFTAAELRSLLDDPGRIRQAIVLNELLGPPLALRS